MVQIKTAKILHPCQPNPHQIFDFSKITGNRPSLPDHTLTLSVLLWGDLLKLHHLEAHVRIREICMILPNVWHWGETKKVCTVPLVLYRQLYETQGFGAFIMMWDLLSGERGTNVRIDAIKGVMNY